MTNCCYNNRMKNKKETILVVDDTEENIDILVELLSKEYDVVVALNGRAALEALHESRVDLILLDIMMPDLDGYEVCKILKEDENLRDIPVIFITAIDDEKSIQKAYEAGGIDYITKPFKPLELMARVATQLKVKALIEHLAYISSHDEMSGVYNRRKFFEVAQKRFLEEKDELYAVMIDIDNFKKINDTYGHPKGDEVIRCVASTIAQNLQNDAIFARMGGEEFAIVCSCESSEILFKMMQEIVKKIDQSSVSAQDKESICFTISLGVAKYKKSYKTLDELLKQADLALYEAKGCGKNRVVFRG